MQPDILMLLVDIVESGSLSEAARRSKMTRANVSYHLAQLEKSAGVQLVRRTTRRIEPTEAGMRLYEHGRAIRIEMQAAQESVSSLRNDPVGRLRLSVPSGYGQLVMSRWLIDFKKQYPRIVLDVTFENRVEDLLREEVDIAVRVMSEPPDNLVARDLGPVNHIACSSHRYAEQFGVPATIEALAAAPLLTSGVAGRQLRLSAYRAAERLEVSLSPTVLSENFAFLRLAILDDLGIGLVPDYVVRDDVALGTVVTFLPEWRLSIFGSRMFLLYMSNTRQTRTMAAFIEFVLARASAFNARPPTPAGPAAAASQS